MDLLIFTLLLSPFIVGMLVHDCWVRRDQIMLAHLAKVQKFMDKVELLTNPA